MTNHITGLRTLMELSDEALNNKSPFLHRSHSGPYNIILEVFILAVMRPPLSTDGLQLGTPALRPIFARYVSSVLAITVCM